MQFCIGEPAFRRLRMLVDRCIRELGGQSTGGDVMRNFLTTAVILSGARGLVGAVEGSP